MRSRVGGTVFAAVCALTACLGLPGVAVSATLKADYRFEGNLKSSAGPVQKLVRQGSGDFVEKAVKGSREGVLQYELGTGLRLGDATEAVASDRGNSRS